MSLNVIDGRIVEKVSTVPGQVPTIGPSFDHTDGTWVASDVYEAEFFVNVIDKKLYMLMNGTIAEIGTSVSASTLAAVLAAGNTTGGNNIEMTGGDQIITPDTTSRLTINTNFFLGDIDDGAGTNALVGLLPTTAALALNTPTTTSSYEIFPGQLNMTTNDSTGSVTTNINLDNSDISITTTDSSFNTTSFIQTSANQILAKSDDSTNSMEMAIEPNQVYIQDQSANLLFQVNSVGVVLPEFFTPTSSADTTGVVGQLTLDNNYIYVKTATGWKRSALSSF